MCLSFPTPTIGINSTMMDMCDADKLAKAITVKSTRPNNKLWATFFSRRISSIDIQEIRGPKSRSWNSVTVSLWYYGTLPHYICYIYREVSNIVLNLIFRSEPLRAQRSTIVRSIPYSKQDVWSAPQSENMFKSFFLPSSPTGSY